MTTLLVIWAFFSFYQPLIRIAFVLFGSAIIINFLTLSSSRKSIKIINFLSKGLIITYFSVGILCMSLIITYKDQEINSPDYILILGDAVKGERPSERLALRLDEGISQYRLFAENPNLKIIVSGGMGKDEYIPEAIAMQRYLISKGISENVILIESKATSTRENLLLSKSIINLDWQASEVPQVLIVSSWFHLYRVHLLADYYEYNYGTQSANTPKALVIQPVIREWFAIVNDFTFVLMK